MKQEAELTNDEEDIRGAEPRSACRVERFLSNLRWHRGAQAHGTNSRQRDRTLSVKNSAPLALAGGCVTWVRAVLFAVFLCSLVVGRLLVRGRREVDNS